MTLPNHEVRPVSLWMRNTGWLSVCSKRRSYVRGKRTGRRVRDGQAAVVVPLEDVAVAPHLFFDLGLGCGGVVAGQDGVAVGAVDAGAGRGDDVLLAVAVDVTDAVSQGLLEEFGGLALELGREVDARVDRGLAACLLLV